MNDMKNGNKYDVKDTVSTSSSGMTNASEEGNHLLLEEIKLLKNENLRLKNENNKIMKNNNNNHNHSNNDDELNNLKNKTKQLTEELSNSANLLGEVAYERDEKRNENSKLLKELLDIKITIVPQIEETNRLRRECSELKNNLQFYSSRLTSMEVELAEMQVAYMSPNRRLSGGTDNHQTPIQSQLPISSSSSSSSSSSLFSSNSNPISTSTSNSILSSSSILKQQQQQKEKQREKDNNDYDDYHDKERQKEKVNVIPKSPVAASTGSKFSNFVNSTKKNSETPVSGSGSVPQGSGYGGGKRVPASN